MENLIKPIINQNNDNVFLALFEKLQSDTDLSDLEYSSGEIIQTNIIDLSFLSLNNWSVLTEVNLEIDLKLNTTHKDLPEAVYDSENNLYFNITEISENSTYKIFLTVIINYVHEFDQGELSNFEIESISDFKVDSFRKTNENIVNRSTSTQY